MHKWLFGGGLLLLAALPSTTTYKLNSYGFGSGSGTGSTSNYSLEGTTGELSGAPTSTSNYKINPGFVQTYQANLPTLTSLDNNSGTYYNKLHFVIDTQGNPSDAKFALQISTDNFSSDVRYIKSDLTVGSTLATTDFQTYASWGSGSGANVIGLATGTTYYVRVAATHGSYTQSPWGPTTSAATASPSITFNLTTSAQGSPPFSIGFGTLTAGSVASATTTVNLVLTTNALNGADIYIKSKNAALKSTSLATTVASATADLGAVGSGYGGQSTSATQTSGGPLAAVSPYDGSSNSVGIIDTANRSLYTSTGPITGGAATFLLKAKVASTTVAASDYADTLTFVASANF